MALTFVKRSELPAIVKGKVGGLSVIVTANGQIQLSKMASEFMNGANKLVMAFDGGKVYLFKPTAKMVVAAKTKDEDMVEIRKSKPGKNGKTKGGIISLTAGHLLKAAQKYGSSHVYDYKGSGDQTFTVTASDKDGCLIFELPTNLPKKAKVARAKKVKVMAAAAGASVPVTTEIVEDELILAS